MIEHFTTFFKELPSHLTDAGWWNEFFWPILFNPINSIFDPDPRYMLGGVFILFLLFCNFLKFFTHPIISGGAALAATFVFIAGLSNPDFQKIIFKGDNVPIVIMLVTVGFFTWWALRQAVMNDEYKEKATKEMLKMSSTVNNDPEEKLHTFPFLVHPEFIATIACTVLLTVWSVAIDAPLEEPSEAARTPNPSKAPWYFLGLQEMLVYFDPWMAGVVMPSYIVVGLMAIPYFDANKKGNGYYTWKERKWAIGLFLFGFVVLWVVLIMLGTMMRGPGWNFFGPFQYWDHNKVEALTSVNLSELLPNMAPALFGWMTPTTPWFIREWAGFLALGVYFVGLPVLGFFVVLKKLGQEMGPLRYFTATHMLLMMFLLVAKMVLRWVVNLKYIIAIPELGLNL